MGTIPGETPMTSPVMETGIMSALAQLLPILP
jgi:hypothetical protein